MPLHNQNHNLWSEPNYSDKNFFELTTCIVKVALDLNDSRCQD